MSADIEQLITAELDEQASLLAPPTSRIDAVRQRSRQRTIRRRVLVSAASGLTVIAVAAGLAVAISAAPESEVSIVAGPTEEASTDKADQGAEEKSPSEPPTRTPTTDPGEQPDTTDDETSRTNPSAAPSPPTSAEPPPTTPTTAPEPNESSSPSSDLPALSDAEADSAALGAPPLPKSATGWQAVTPDGSTWQQWDDTEGCTRRIDSSTGYVGEKVCFDYIYRNGGDWAVEQGAANDSVAWYALSPVGDKLAVELVLSDGTVVPGVVQGEYWAVIVDYSDGSIETSARPDLLRITMVDGSEEIPLPWNVVNAPGTSIALTAALAVG